MWYNRAIMRVLIGFAGLWKIVSGKGKELENAVIQGLILDSVVTGDTFLDEFQGPPEPGAWIVYGMVGDVGASRFSEE